MRKQRHERNEKDRKKQDLSCSSSSSQFTDCSKTVTEFPEAERVKNRERGNGGEVT